MAQEKFSTCFSKKNPKSLKLFIRELAEKLGHYQSRALRHFARLRAVNNMVIYATVKEDVINPNV
eukprot:snap_masked-scaffold_10-processed-gene-13.44-mRNA-1 protein AED:1.00 eAED:1.00 QI:0/-1/0/0/-1/1/1/0/64